MKNIGIVSEIRFKKEGELNPLIVDFLNGSVKDSNLPRLTVNLFPHANMSEKAVEIKSIDGQTYINKKIDYPDTGQIFVAIRNKKTHKIKLVEVEHATLINSIFTAEKEKGEEETNNAQQVTALKKTFGSKKAVRHLEKKEALDVERSVVEDQINEMLSVTNVSEMSTVTNDDGESLTKLIPPCNRNATTVSNVYKIDDCLSENELSSLMNAATEIAENIKIPESDFMKLYLKEALVVKENLKARIACLLYADALVKFIKIHAKNLSKALQTLCPYSSMVSLKIGNEFGVKTGSTITRPLLMKDKAVCYAMVLILIACNFKIDLAVFAKLSNYGFQKMKQLGRVVGLTQVGKSNSVFALALPLPQPPKIMKATKPKK